VAMNLSSNR